MLFARVNRHVKYESKQNSLRIPFAAPACPPRRRPPKRGSVVFNCTSRFPLFSVLALRFKGCAYSSLLAAEALKFAGGCGIRENVARTVPRK